MKRLYLLIFLLLSQHFRIEAQQIMEKPGFDFNEIVLFAELQFGNACKSLNPDKGMPRSCNEKGEWNQVDITDWTSGFFPGSLWYLYELTKNKKWEIEARKWTAPLSELKSFNGSHDLGFMLYCSFGNGYRLTGDELYKNTLLLSGATLATRFNPATGTILSWGNIHDSIRKQHITIIDNMMNLELLMWASKNGGSKSLAEIAVSHADKTKKDHFRKDGSSYHGIVYDRQTGKILNKRSYQGYHDESMWARGQSWGIYGFIMMYRETGDKRYLKKAERNADLCIENLPEDFVPFWDYDSPYIPTREKDASSGAILASALLEMYEHTRELKYYNYAILMLNELSTESYLAKKGNYQGIILHSVGSYPAGSEINVHLNYADYYYLEALVRLKKLNQNGSIFSTLQVNNK